MKKLLETNDVKTAYRRYAAIYDALFGAVFEPGRRAAVQAANRQPHQRVLEVGVGTGLSLTHYRKDARVTGIDISPEMLERGRRRVVRLRLDHVDTLAEMNAEAMEFPDNSFDTVIGMYMASVVENPARVLAEMRRVCVPGGEIVFVNHFTSDNAFLRGTERALTPLSSVLGFKPDFQLGPLLDLADIEVLEVKPVNLFGYWKLVRMRNVPRGVSGGVSVGVAPAAVDYALSGSASAAE